MSISSSGSEEEQRSSLRGIAVASKTFPQAYVGAWTNDGGLLLDYCFEKLSGVG